MKKLKHVQTVLNSVRTLGKVADRETGLIASEILVKTWNLAKSSTTYANAKDVVLFVLKHNIATGGGCIPGISARLTLPYSHFVTAQLEDRHFKALRSLYSPTAAAATGPVSHSDDDALALAIQESLRDTLPPKPAAASSSISEQDLELALAIQESLRFSEPPKPTAAATARPSAAAKSDFSADEIELATALSLSMS
jgi:hypothetical protein